MFNNLIWVTNSRVYTSIKIYGGGHEKDKNQLIMAELSYLELAHRYNFKTIECANGKKPKSIEEISEIVYKIVNDFINKKGKQKKIN